ncbi:uncharacterized protein [Aegilops tauschii subsp. strangulata]|uniref:uncharacterized protein n=1 Tax=Aegilops tauschii subsp. strangulata TaxID=200361 RepID=UPI001E1CAD00|nr:uncharacterized protein LOC109753406 [Aegilops tauschii subsp. strangulata]
MAKVQIEPVRTGEKRSHAVPRGAPPRPTSCDAPRAAGRLQRPPTHTPAQTLTTHAHPRPGAPIHLPPHRVAPLRPQSAARRWIQAGNRHSAPPGGGSGPATIPLLPHDWFPLLCVKIDGVQHVEAGRHDAAVADLLQRLLFDSEITGNEHNQMRTCVRVACVLLLAIAAVHVHRADYVPCHPQGFVLGIGGGRVRGQSLSLGWKHVSSRMFLLLEYLCT